MNHEYEAENLHTASKSLDTTIRHLALATIHSSDEIISSTHTDELVKLAELSSGDFFTKMLLRNTIRLQQDIQISISQIKSK